MKLLLTSAILFFSLTLNANELGTKNTSVIQKENSFHSDKKKKRKNKKRKKACQKWARQSYAG
jgi:16S rRNA U1498 N3-methylase RsmE